MDAALRAQDAGAGGLVAAMTALAEARAAPDAIFAALAPWLDDGEWVAARLAALTAFAASDPFAMPPVRIFGGGGVLGGLILAEVPPITLSLMVRPFDQSGAAGGSIIFSPGQGQTRIIRSGGARIRRYRVALSPEERGGGFRIGSAARAEQIEERALADGEVIRTDQQCESFTLRGGDGDIVMLQLFVHQSSRVPMREYDPASGQIIKLAAAARATSFRQMGLAVLRAFGRRDAAPLFAAALDDSDFAMRWQVMREWIALDTAAALPHLTRLAAGDPHPEVRAAAAATLRMVRERVAA